MSVADILLGFLIASGFFVSAAVSRMFRRSMTGIVFGGVVGIAVSVAILWYGFAEFFASASLPAAE